MLWDTDKYIVSLLDWWSRLVATTECSGLPTRQMLVSWDGKEQENVTTANEVAVFGLILCINWFSEEKKCIYTLILFHDWYEKRRV